jgi:hypothetical protein
MVSGTTSGFGLNQIYLKLKLGARQFMPGIKNLILIFFFNFKQKKITKKKSKISNFKSNFYKLILNYKLKIKV